MSPVDIFIAIFEVWLWLQRRCYKHTVLNKMYDKYSVHILRKAEAVTTMSQLVLSTEDGQYARSDI